MALRCSLPATCSTFCLTRAEHPSSRAPPARLVVSFGSCPGPRPSLGPVLAARPWALRASDPKAGRLVIGGGPRNADADSDSEDEDEGPVRMTDQERRTLRRKIREMMDRMPETQELTDPEEKKAKMRELLTKYQLVVEEEDPEWPEDAQDGMGFGLDQFFDKITIKPEKRDDADDDDAVDDGKKEVVWEDDNYIKPVRDVKTKDWDDTVFTDFGPLIVLVHNRYKRPQDNEMARTELVKAIETFWEHDLPSPRVCVAVDACAEPDLVAALKVSGFPELLFTNAGKILHREKAVRSAEVLARMIAFFYYKAARPPCLSESDGQGQEKVPLMS